MQAVSAANRAYYDAFERRDIDAMSDVWEHADRVLCTHPGWVTLRGWAAVGGSFVALFGNDQTLQFLLTDEHVEVLDRVAWVSIDENILGGQGGAMVSALNVFVDLSGNGEWKLVCHQATLVSPPTENE